MGLAALSGKTGRIFAICEASEANVGYLLICDINLTSFVSLQMAGGGSVLEGW